MIFSVVKLKLEREALARQRLLFLLSEGMVYAVEFLLVLCQMDTFMFLSAGKQMREISQSSHVGGFNFSLIFFSSYTSGVVVHLCIEVPLVLLGPFHL